MEIIEGNLIDIENREFYPCAISISEGKIINIERNSNSYDSIYSPGFIDAHVHVEKFHVNACRVFQISNSEWNSGSGCRSA